MTKIAIVIAVENYSDTSISPVKYAASDAQDLVAAFEQHGFFLANQMVLVDAKATKTTIESRVRTQVAALTAEDTLYFYYAGHGFAEKGKNYITCYDSHLSDLEDTSIRLDWLFQQFKNSACNRIVMFLDSCDSGMQLDESVRGIYSHFTDTELKTFFDRTEHYVCFAACKPGQKSYGSHVHKHGIWTYHLIDALMGNATQALERSYLLTSSSLQNFLADEVPRTIRTEYHGKHVQTPWVCGASSSEFLVADVQPILLARESSANPGVQQVKDVRLFAEYANSVRSLKGFQKHHHVPNAVTASTEEFIYKIAEKELEEDLAETFEALRGAYSFRRRDMKKIGPDGGSGSISTPYFNYNVSVTLNPDDASEVFWCREVTSIREPPKIFSDEFEQAFGKTFDTLEFHGDKDFNLEVIVDRIEALDGDEITVDYDPDLTWCEIHLDGTNARIRVTVDTFQVRTSGEVAPKQLVQSFFEIQQLLVNKHGIQQLPFETNGHGNDKQ